jgi:hypothetical protein
MNGRISTWRLTLHSLAKSWLHPVSSLNGLIISGTHTLLIISTPVLRLITNDRYHEETGAPCYKP